MNHLTSAPSVPADRWPYDVTPDEILDMIYHLEDCGSWADIDTEEIQHLDTDQILAGIQRHYTGGIVQFRKDIR